MPAPNHKLRTDATEGSLYHNMFMTITATYVLASVQILVQILGASQNVLVQQMVIWNIYVSFSGPA